MTQGCPLNGKTIIVTGAISGIRRATAQAFAGIDHLTRCAALKMAPHGVRVSGVNPGTHPLGRPGQPEEVAALRFTSV